MKFKILPATAFADEALRQLDTAADMDAIRSVTSVLEEDGGVRRWPSNRGRDVLDELDRLDGYERLADAISKYKEDEAYFAWSCKLLGEGYASVALMVLGAALRHSRLRPQDRAFCEHARNALLHGIVGTTDQKDATMLLNILGTIKGTVSPVQLDAAERFEVVQSLENPAEDPRPLLKAIIEALQGDDGWPSDADGLDIDRGFKGDPKAVLAIMHVLFNKIGVSEDRLAVRFVGYLAASTSCVSVPWIVKALRAHCAVDALGIDTSDPGQYDVPHSFDDDEGATERPADPVEGQVIVAKKYPSATGSRHSDRTMALNNHKVLSKPLDLIRLTVNLDHLYTKLMAEFPWMARATELVCRDLELRQAYGKQAIDIPPLLLWGAPGTGKTRYCLRLAEHLGLPFSALSFAGSSDDRMLRGTGAGWGGAQPAFPVTKMAETECANPLFLVDEIEKAAAEANRNGNPLTTMLMYLEPENARTFYDECLMTDIDLSHINWVATANSLKGLTQPLLSRMRVIETPLPKPEHIPAIIRGVRADFAREMSVDVRFVPELDEAELLFLERAFRNTPNVRTITRMSQKLLDRRERIQREQPN